MNGVVEFESHPRISKARSAVMPVMSAQPPKSAGKAMQSVRNHFREGLSQPIGYLVICMQMKSGWLGMLYQGTKFTRLAALSPNTIAIEFGEHNPHFWAEPSWDSTSADAENGPSALKAPTDNTTTQLDSIAPGFQELTTPTVITMEQIFDLPNRLHERLGFELVKQDTLNSQLPDLNEDAVQTLLDFFVAAAFDRLHLPLSAANEAIDWSKVEDCPLHKHLLSMCAQAAINQDLHDEVAWRAGPQKITRALVRKVNQSAVPELQDQTPSTTAATHRDSEYIVQKRRRLERDHSRDVDGHDEDGVESSSSGSSEDPDKSDHHSSKSHGGDNGKDDKSGGDRDAQNHSRHSFDDNGSVRSSSRRSSASSNSSHRGDDDVDDGGRVQRGHPSMERQNDGSASDNIDHHSDSRGPAEAESCSAQQHWRSSTGGLFYAINDARRQKNLSYKCRLEALRDLGIKLVAVSTADMNTIIEEHIQAFDRYDDTGSGSGTHPRTAGDSGRSLGHESVTSEHQPSTRPRTLPRQSDESETSERLSIMLAPAGSSVKQAFLRPSSTDAALSGGEGITSRMRDLSLGKAAPKPSTMRSSPTPDQTA